jgi:crossover junction endodeoxyribonuclease RuvC
VIILGIDPGTASLGYGIVERTGGRLRAVDYGTLATSPDVALPDRLVQIHALVAELIETHHPDLVAVERLFFSRNVQTALAVGQARGVVLLAAAQAGISVREATPSEVKLGVTGYGSADKGQVARMVTVILELAEVPTPDDTSDALAIAICIANRERPEAQGNTGSGSARAPILDRAAVAPITRGETPYERAVREALARDTRPGGKTRRPAAATDRGGRTNVRG